MLTEKPTEMQYLEGDITADPKPDLDEIEQAKAENDFTPEEERRLVRKIDLWIVPLMMVTYTLQSYDKGILSAATQFGLNTDLGLTTVIGHTAAGVAITNNQKYSNASMIFYIGYLVGTYPMMYLSQRYPTSRVIAGATFLWGAVIMSTAGVTNYAGIMLNRFCKKYASRFHSEVPASPSTTFRKSLILSSPRRLGVYRGPSIYRPSHILVDKRRASTPNGLLVLLRGSGDHNFPPDQLRLGLDPR